MYGITEKLSGSMYPPHEWLSWISGSPRVDSKKHDRRNEPLNVWTPMTLVSKQA